MRGQGPQDDAGMQRALTMDAIHIHVPVTCEDQAFHGPRAEGVADAWLRRHVLSALAWEWVVKIKVEFEQGFAVEVDHRVRPGHTNGSVRDAVVAYFIGRSRDQALPEETRTSARVLAQGVKGEPLPIPVMRMEWDLRTRETVLVPASPREDNDLHPFLYQSDRHRPV